MFLFQDICIVSYGRMGQSFELAINCKYSERWSMILKEICTGGRYGKEIGEWKIKGREEENCNIIIEEEGGCWERWERGD